MITNSHGYVTFTSASVSLGSVEVARGLCAGDRGEGSVVRVVRALAAARGQREGTRRASVGSVVRYTVGAFIVCATAFAVAWAPLIHAQEDPSAKLQNLEPNDYRGAKKVSSPDAVLQNMKDLFAAILLTSAADSAKDKWYSPHLRDITIGIFNRIMEGWWRGRTIPYDFMYLRCWNIFGPRIPAACPGPMCDWHGAWGGPHRPWLSCFRRNTRIYHQFLNDNNWKTCCVRDGEERLTSEQIVSLHPDGDGWAGLVEVNYPVTAFGWENDRTTTMIADQSKVAACVGEVERRKLMENETWVAGAIKRNLKAVGGDAGGAGGIEEKVARDISDVRPQDQNNRFADNLNNIGLTVRPLLAALHGEYRKILERRFCGRPGQFDKLMTIEDNVQLGGGLSVAELDRLKMWANYCPEAVGLMTMPPESQVQSLKNLDGTPTNFDEGIKAWIEDPLYCQKMHLATNPNLTIKGFDTAINQTKGAPKDEKAVGYTCLKKGTLNASMVPLSFTRNSFVERRTAIADQAIAFLIAAGIAPGMHAGKLSYLKRFEPQPYSMTLGEPYKAFTGKQMRGAGTNELVRTDPAFSSCLPLSGENLQFQNKADRIYISNKFHDPFTQEIIDERKSIDRYVQEWAEQSKKEKIAERGLNEKSLNYGAAFRIVAMCPSGWTRWRPPKDEHAGYLAENVDLRCREEYFGGVP